MGNIYVSSKFTFISHYREHVKISQLSTWKKKIQNIYTVNDLINALGVYLILGVQARAFKRGRRFITVTISTKLMCFRLYFKLDVEQDKIRQALLIKQESE